MNAPLLADAAARRQVEAEIPLGRFGLPEEVAAAGVWAASDQAAYVTGTPRWSTEAWAPARRSPDGWVAAPFLAPLN